MSNSKWKDLIEYLELAVGNIKAIEECDNGGDMNDLLQNLDTLMELINEKWRNLTEFGLDTLMELINEKWRNLK